MPTARGRRPSLILLALAVSLSLPTPARGEVFAWHRLGRWEVVPVTFPGGPIPWQPLGLTFSALGQTGGVTGLYAQMVPGNLPQGGTLLGNIRGRDGLALRGVIDDPVFGEGKFKATLAPTLDMFEGTVTFGHKPDQKRGTFKGVYVPTTGDFSDVELRAVWSAKRKARCRKPGSIATVVVVIENRGPYAQPLGFEDLLVTFTSEGQPVSVEVDDVVQVGGPGLQAGDARSLDPLRIPIAVKERLTLAVKVKVPLGLEGKLLTANARLFPTLLEYPDYLARASADVEVCAPGQFAFHFLLRNKARENIHIYLKTNPDPFADATRVAPGGTKGLKVLTTTGEFLRFGAGRAGRELASCSGQVNAPGRATITYQEIGGQLPLLVCGG
jgi:hypothetical protein